MQRRILPVLLIGLFFGFASSAGAATKVFNYKFSGNNASAYSETVRGCFREGITVQAFESISRQLGKDKYKTADTFVFVNLIRDDCGAITTINAYSTVPATNFVIDKRLATARLNATITGYDQFNNPFPVQVVANWTAGDDGSQTTGRSTFGSSVSHWKQDLRVATARVSLSYYGQTINAVPYYAELSRVTNGYKALVRN